MSAVVTDQTEQKARAPRTNLLLAATIESGPLKGPVRIRNMSESGALIDGAVLPNIGDVLILRRLEVEIGAHVVWRANGRCGIQFNGKASVPDWVAGVPRLSFPGPSSGQAQVDAIQAAIRTGQPTPAAPTQQPDTVPADLDRRLAEELAYVRRLLDGVGDELTDDPVIVQRHARMLQNFDIACQILEHIGGILIATDRDSAVKAVTMQDLRARLTRKSLY